MLSYWCLCVLIFFGKGNQIKKKERKCLLVPHQEARFTPSLGFCYFIWPTRQLATPAVKGLTCLRPHDWEWELGLSPGPLGAGSPGPGRSSSGIPTASPHPPLSHFQVITSYTHQCIRSVAVWNNTAFRRWVLMRRMFCPIQHRPGTAPCPRDGWQRGQTRRSRWASERQWLAAAFSMRPDLAHLPYGPVALPTVSSVTAGILNSERLLATWIIAPL